MTGDDLRGVIRAVTPLNNPRLSEVPWDLVAWELDTLDAHPAPLDIVEDRTPEQLAADGDARPAPDTALDVERLALVMREMCDCIRSDEDAAAWARDIAREYAALAPADREEEL